MSDFAKSPRPRYATGQAPLCGYTSGLFAHRRSLEGIKISLRKEFLEVPLNKAHGFTLIEVLVATFFLAVIAISMAQIMEGITDTKNAASLINDRSHLLQLVLDKMQDDLNMAFLADSKFAGSDNKFVSGFKAGEDFMHFSTLANMHVIKNKRETDQVHVGYTVEKNDAGSFSLLRRKTDYLRDKLEEGGMSFVLLSTLKEVQFAYYDSNKKEWKNEWDSDSISYAGRLPQMVKVILKLARARDKDKEDKKEEEIEYEVLISLDLYKTKISF